MKMLYTSYKEQREITYIWECYLYVI